MTAARPRAAGPTAAVRVWDLTGAAPPTILSGHDGAVHAVAYGPGGRSVASGGWDGTVRLWRVAAGQQAALLPGWIRNVDGRMGAVSGIAVSPDGRTVAVADGGDRVRLWPVP